MAKKKRTKLISYLGKPIKKSTLSCTAILDEFGISEYQLLERRYPFLHPNRDIDEEVFYIGKYLGKGKIRHPFIYIIQTKTSWYRLATLEEKKVFDEEPK